MGALGYPRFKLQSREHSVRKTLEASALAMLAVLVVAVMWALFGPNRLPDRVATHFDLAGHPNGWSSPLGLLLLPVIGVFIYVLMTVLSRDPSRFNYPVQVTPQNRPVLESLSLDMISWLKAELIGTFLWIDLDLIYAARRPERGNSIALVWIPLGVVFFTIGRYIWLMSRARPSAA